MSDENIKPTNTKFWLKFDGHYIQQIKVNFNHKAILNFYIAYKVNIWPQYVGVDFALRNLFFYLVKLAENAYCIQHVWIFSMLDGVGIGHNVTILLIWVHMCM